MVSGTISPDESFAQDYDTKRSLAPILKSKMENKIFYDKSSVNVDDQWLKLLFEVFKNIEEKQIDILMDMGVDAMPSEKQIKVYEFDEDNIVECSLRKKRLIESYDKIVKSLRDPFLVEVFSAFSEVEKIHLFFVDDSEGHRN